MNAKEWLGDKWARLKAYVRSIPPDVWLGLGIGALALLLAWLAFRNRGASSGDSGLSTDNPILPAAPTDPLSNPSTDNNNILNWIDPGGNLTKAKPTKAVTSVVDDYAARMHQRSIVQSYDIHAASATQTARILVSQQQGAVVHSRDIHTASLVNAAKAQIAKALAATTTRDESQTARAITHPLAVVKPPTGRRQDVAY